MIFSHRRFAFVVAAFAVLNVTLAAEKELRGHVVSITDGDTLVVLDSAKVQHKIRLEGIDAPESGQSFGTKAKTALSDRVFDKEVRVLWEKTDRYKRILGHVYIGDRWINQELVSEGWAWHFKKYNSDERLSKAETAAREAKRGLWADKEPEAPWDYRERKRAKRK